MSESGDWDGWGTDNGMHIVHVSSRACSAEEAVGQLVQRARQKYGASLEFMMWRFWVKKVDPIVPGQLLHYRVDENGRPVRLDL